MKLKEKFRRGAIFALALVLASVSSLAVYASVSYDSSKDPVVAYSGMVAYVESVLEDIRATLASIDTRLKLLELAGPPASGDSTGEGGGGGGGISSEQLAEILAEIEALKASNAELKEENAALKNDMKNIKNELLSLIDELSSEYDALKNSLSSLSTGITNLQNQLSSMKNDLSTLEKNFKQISDISTRLETLTYKVNNLTASNGDIATLKSRIAELEKQLDTAFDELGKIYSIVFVPYGATVYAKDDDDTVMFILRSGSAVAISPYNEMGKIQGINDVTTGVDILDGESIPLFHSILIPRGGNDGRGVKVTALEGAYFLIGGDYTIVEP